MTNESKETQIDLTPVQMTGLGLVNWLGHGAAMDLASTICAVVAGVRPPAIATPEQLREIEHHRTIALQAMQAFRRLGQVPGSLIRQ